MRITYREVMILLIILAFGFFASLIYKWLEQFVPEPYIFFVGAIGLIALLFVLKRFPLLRIG